MQGQIPSWVGMTKQQSFVQQ